MLEAIQIRDKEAQKLSSYLIGQSCSAGIEMRYSEAVNKLNATLTEGEQKTWDTMLSSSFYLKLVDSGLAIISSQSPLRKRVFIMLALLEASPDHTAYFLPQARSIFYIIPLGFRLGFSALYLMLGVIITKAYSLK